MKKAFSLKRLSSAFKYAFKGFGKVYKNEDNMKVHVVVAILDDACIILKTEINHSYLRSPGAQPYILQPAPLPMQTPCGSLRRV